MPLNIDLQAITWKKCKDDVFEHIATGHATLKDYLNHTSKFNKIYWFSFIEGNDQYGSHNGEAVQILDHLQLINFATRAYNAYPREIMIQVVMAKPQIFRDLCTGLTL
jgi:hypothetical protein